MIATRCFLITTALFGFATGQAQQLWLEEFDGGGSTIGFWIDSLNVTDCRWEFAPDSVGPEDFSQDFSGYWPAGPGFDSSFGLRDTRVLEQFLSLNVFDSRCSSAYTGFRLFHLSFVVFVLELNQQIPCVYLLVVINDNPGNRTGHARTQRRQVGSHVGIIGLLYLPTAHPRIPIAHDRKQNRTCQQQNGDGN